MISTDPDETDGSECSMESTSVAGYFKEVENNMEKMANTDRRPQKRNRERDIEDTWTTVGRKGKRFARTNEGEPLPDDRYEVCMTGPEQLPKQFKLAKLLQSEKISDVSRVKYVNSYKVLIQFCKEESMEEFINSMKFKEMGFKIYKTMEVTHTYGVIRDIDLDLTDEEILQSLTCNIQILGIKRLLRKNRANGKWENCEKMRVCFKGSSLPPHVKIFDTIAEVTPYVYPVTQCFRCWRYGHSLKICPSYKMICPKCGGDHANCTTTTFKCNNCGGKHMAMAKICPIFVKEKRIRELMSEFGVSYKRALTLYVPVSPLPAAHQLFEYTEADFPKTNKGNQDDSDADVPDRSAERKSYAEATKKEALIKKKKQRKGATKNINFEEGFETNEEMETNEQEVVQNEKGESATGERKKNSGLGELLKKLKEKICDSSLTWEEKIKACWKILYSEILTIVVQYLSDWPWLKSLNLNGLLQP